MKVTGLAICPPKGAEDNPKVTPELLASCLAKYSRSNKGIESILAGIDWSDPDRAVEAIFKFVDYGHASIGGLTGGIAMTVDGASMWLAYKLFEIAQLADGQESSTRYIQMSPASLPEPEEVGIPASLANEWRLLMGDSFRRYAEIYEDLDCAAQEQPEIVRYPAGANEKVITRIRKNFALDRARSLIPFATRTNLALVMSARVWAETIRRIDGFDLPEARHCATLLREELAKFAPRLIRHSVRDAASVAQARYEIEIARSYIEKNGVGTENVPDEVYVKVDREFPRFLPSTQTPAESFAGKQNRYSFAGEAIRRSLVRFAWNNVSLAELRDLNRHRSGHRFAPLMPVGFYVAPEVPRSRIQDIVDRQSSLVSQLARQSSEGAHVYGYLLGVQTPFEHATNLDKLIYEIELRTGLGSHFRYAEHLEAVWKVLSKEMPELIPHVEIGTAEPE